MRTGLVVLGVAFVVVGSAALGTLYLEPPGSVHVLSTSTYFLELAGPAGPATTPPLWGQNGTRAIFLLAWEAPTPVDVAIYPGNGSAACLGRACGPAPLARWSSARSGTFDPADPVFPYWLEARLGTNGTTTVTVTTRSVSNANAGWPTLGLLAVAGTGLLVVGIGGVALFLGLFLRSDPYGPPRPPRRRDGRPEPAAPPDGPP